jgi:PAS domain S-box-containing protein
MPHDKSQERNPNTQEQLNQLQDQFNAAQARLLNPSSLSAMVLDIIDEGVCITNSEGYFTEVNEAYTKLYGYKREEVIGQHFTMMLPEEAREAATQLHDDFIAGHRVETPAEWSVRNKEGEERIVYVKPARYIDHDGRVYKVTTVSDLTERKALESQLESLTQSSGE